MTVTTLQMLGGSIKRTTDPERDHLSNEQMVAELKQQGMRRAA